MSNIEAIAPRKATGKAAELIADLWDAFNENYEAFKAGEMPLEDEVKYHLFSSPGPTQYKAFFDFFNILEDGKEQIWALKEYMYMHDFADIKDGTTEPDILEILQNLYNVDDYNPKIITLVSGLFWGQHFETRAKIMQHFNKFHDKKNKKNKIRILTRAKKDDIGSCASIFSANSKFYMKKRIPFHYVRAGNDYLYYEFPHTESSVFRLNMLLDLNTLKYKKGKSKADMLRFLDSLIKKAL